MNTLAASYTCNAAHQKIDVMNNFYLLYDKVCTKVLLSHEKDSKRGSLAERDGYSNNNKVMFFTCLAW